MRKEILHPPKKIPSNTAKNHINKVTFGCEMVININIIKKWESNLHEGFRVARNEWLAFIKNTLLSCMHQLVMERRN